jgi:hypothetical protein
MALLRPAKTSLWAALRALRLGDTQKARKAIQEALIYLEMTPAMIDPALVLKS